MQICAHAHSFMCSFLGFFARKCGYVHVVITAKFSSRAALAYMCKYQVEGDKPSKYRTTKNNNGDV